MHRSKQSGATMVEVLVAIVVIAIGLLGIVGMQALGLRNNHTASIRSQATMMAYDLADRVRANPGGAASYDFDVEGDLPTAEVADCKQETGTCTNANMASHDVYVWLQDLANSMPDGQGTICLDNSPDIGTPADFKCEAGGSVYVIKVWWDENKTGVEAQYKGFYTEFVP